MFTKQKYINIISFLIILCVNTLFILKYSVIYTTYPAIVSLGYVVLFTGLIYTTGNLKIPQFLTGKNFLVIISLLLSAGALTYIIFVPRMGQIGRLPAIEDWIQRFQNGLFPYNSPHTPSSFPVIFWLAFPFYMAGNTGLLEFIGTAIFLFIVFTIKDSDRGKFVRILMLAGSTVFIYEIVTRSELFFNMMLVSGIVMLCEKFLDPGKINFKFFIMAVLTGLVLCTRSVAALLFVIYFLFLFRNEIRDLFLFAVISLLIFILFLLPIYIWDPVSFMNTGPFAVQSYLSNLPRILIIVIFVAAFYSGWVISDVQEFFFSGGIILFIAAASSFLIRAFSTGFYESLINDGYDIAYFIFCVPMLLLSIKDYKTDRFLGKVEGL